MTSQERPVEEQNEVEQLTGNGAVAVVDQEPPQQTQEESANTADTVAASSADVERTASATAQAEATTDEENERVVGSAAEPAPATPDATGDTTPEGAIEAAPAQDAANDVEATPVVDATPDGETAAEESADSGSADADSGETSTLETTNAVSPEADTDVVSPEAATGAAPAEEASFTPVAEEDSGKPRRVKDLQPGMELEGRVTSIALYGIFVDLGVGRDGLVHISEMSNTRIDSPSDLVQIGDTVKVRVKEVSPDGRRISLTMRSADAPSRRGGRKKPELDRELLANLRIGDTVEGTVTGIAPFGVFVDIGAGKDGLVHISELSEGRVEKAEDAVQIGRKYGFKILEVDAQGTRISLSLRRAARAQRLQELEKGQILEGTISGLAPFGAFVDIGVGRDGLIHISELSENRVDKVEDVVKPGDKVQVRVLEMEPNSKRISLSMILEDKPREAAPAPTPERQPERQQEPRPRREFPTLQDRQERQERVRRDDRSRRERDDRQQPIGATSEVYATTTEETDDEPANATLEDLVSKFSGGRRGEKRRRNDDDDEYEELDRGSRRQRDAIRRTLQQMGDDE